MCVRECVCAYVSVYVCVRVFMYVCVRVFMYVCVRVFMYVCVRALYNRKVNIFQFFLRKLKEEGLKFLLCDKN